MRSPTAERLAPPADTTGSRPETPKRNNTLRVAFHIVKDQFRVRNANHLSAVLTRVDRRKGEKEEK